METERYPISELASEGASHCSSFFFPQKNELPELPLKVSMNKETLFDIFA